MGSKKKTNWAAIVAAQQKQAAINRHNSNEKQRGTTLDNNWVAQKNAIVQKEGAVDYKKFLKTRLSDLSSVLGVKR